eukprot:scaffold31956_cov19-Tisochrysis_lutea.AAC.1
MASQHLPCSITCTLLGHFRGRILERSVQIAVYWRVLSGHHWTPMDSQLPECSLTPTLYLGSQMPGCTTTICTTLETVVSNVMQWRAFINTNACRVRHTRLLKHGLKHRTSCCCFSCTVISSAKKAAEAHTKSPGSIFYCSASSLPRRAAGAHSRSLEPIGFTAR